MPTLAAYPGMMLCARKREGLRAVRSLVDWGQRSGVPNVRSGGAVPGFRDVGADLRLKGGRSCLFGIALPALRAPCKECPERGDNGQQWKVRSWESGSFFWQQSSPLELGLGRSAANGTGWKYSWQSARGYF
jgi:hypothetical protein